MIMQLYTLYHEKNKVHDIAPLYIDDEAAAYDLTMKIPPEKQAVSHICHVGSINVLTGEISTHPLTRVDWDDIPSTPILGAPMEFGPQTFESQRDAERQFLNRTADVGHKQKNS